MRVATYNLLHGRDVRHGGRVDLSAAADAIAALDADVVALQEVDCGLERTGRVDQTGWLAARLNLYGVFAPALLGDPNRSWAPPRDGDASHWDGPAYGVALLSRVPLGEIRRTLLPGGGAGVRRRPGTPQRPGWDREPRVALRAQLDAPGLGDLAVTTTHLSYLPWRGVRQLRAAVRAAVGARAVLIGDFNLPPGPVRQLTRSWRHVRAAPTYPSWEPRVQVDQALLRGLRAREWEMPPITTSDHRPLVIEISAG